MDIQYRKAMPDEYGRILPFLQEISPGYGFTDEWFRWKYVNNPMGPPYIYFAEDREKGVLAGIYCLISWTMKSGSRRVKAVQSVDTMINPSYRGLGIVKHLSNVVFTDLKDQGVEIVIGFPNDDFFPTTLKIGWKNPGYMRSYVKILSVDKILGGMSAGIPGVVRKMIDAILAAPDRMIMLRRRGLCVEEISEITEASGEWNLSSRGTQTERSHPYLRWRYAENPLRDYRFYQVSEHGRDVCRFVTRQEGREVSLIDMLYGSDMNMLPALAAFSWFLRAGGAVALRTSCLGDMAPRLKKAGFIPRENGLPLVTYPIREGAVEDRLWQFMPGDIDVM